MGPPTAELPHISEFSGFPKLSKDFHRKASQTIRTPEDFQQHPETFESILKGFLEHLHRVVDLLLQPRVGFLWSG